MGNLTGRSRVPKRSPSLSLPVEAIEGDQAIRLLRHLPALVLLVDAEGSVLFGTGPNGDGLDPGPASSLFSYFRPESHESLLRALAETAHTGKPQSCEAQGVSPGIAGAPCFLRIGPTSQPGVLAATVTDITPLKEHETELRRSEATSRALLNALPDLVFRVTVGGTYLDFNASGGGAGLFSDEVVGRHLSEFLPEHAASAVMEGVSRALSTRQTQAVEYAVGEHEPSWYEATLAMCGDSEVVAVARDITARKRTEAALTESIRDKDLAYRQAVVYSVELKSEIRQRKVAEQALRDLSLRLVSVQEAERRRIARELHDEIGQLLTGLKLILEAERGPQSRESLKLVNELMDAVHDLSLELRPAILDDAGLLPALLWLFERFTSQTRVKVRFEHRGIDRRFPAELETAAYRVTQETLTNVARHAHTGEAWVDIRTRGRKLLIEIGDHGTGFDPDAAMAARRSGGLAGMRERITLLDGKLRIQSSSDTGTHVSAALPIRGK